MSAEKAVYPVQAMARVLGVTRSGYYAWCARPQPVARQQANQALRRRLRLIHADSLGSYGSPACCGRCATRAIGSAAIA